MRWFIAILMTFSLLTESHAIAFSSFEVKRGCCCHQAQPICPPTQQCSTVTVVPRIVQERVATQGIVKQAIIRSEIRSSESDFKNRKKTTLFCNLAHFAWCENFTAPVSWHDYLRVWQT